MKPKLLLIFLLLIISNSANAVYSTSEVNNYIQTKLKNDSLGEQFIIKYIDKCTILITTKHDDYYQRIRLGALDLAKLSQLKFSELYNVLHRGVYINLAKHPDSPDKSFIRFSKVIKIPQSGLPPRYYYSPNYEILVKDVDTATRIAKGFNYLAQSCGAKKEMF